MSDSKNEKPEGADDHLMDHAYDGIQEFDNPMPRWWVWSYWATFWFALAYLFHYWVGNGVSVADDYDAEMAVINAARAKEAMSQQVSAESLEQMMADAASVSAGSAVFMTRCVACHLSKGEGSIGPNLTDAHWIHGKGELMDIFNVVSEGVAAKGMPAWSRQLTPAELRQVVVFVGTLRGTNVPGKAPEGEAVP
jgi:cytochrome c oxidase cbb3-type subunit 3